MNTEKRLCLLAAGLALTLALLFMAPVFVSVPSVDGSLSATPQDSFLLSGATAPPETTIHLAGTPGLNDWFTSDVTVSFTVEGSEADFTTAYSFDGTTWITYASPFVISTEGITTVYYNSTDSVDSVEETKVRTIQIDKSAPDAWLETENIPGEGTLVTIVAIEDVSYLVDIGYTLDGGRWIRYPGPILLTQEGLQPFYYRATDLAGNTISKLDYVEVVILPTISEAEVTYSGDLVGVYSDPINLEATLIDTLTGLPIPDKWIVFTLGTQSVSPMTNTEGVALATLVLDQPAGVYDLTVSFEGDEAYLATSVIHEFVIMKELALIHYSGLTIIEETDSTLTLMATVLEDSDGYLGDLSNILATFTIYHSCDPTVPLQVIGPVIVVPTDIAGVGIASVEIPNLPAGDYLVVVSLDQDQNLYYESPDSEGVTLTVYEPRRGKTMGFGYVRDADGNKGFFAFHVKYSHRGTLRGYVHYTLRIDNYVYFLHSTEITGFVIDGNHAFFEATAFIYQYNIETGETIKLDGTFRLRIDVWDVRRRCGGDIFQMRIYDERGLIVYEVGFDPQEETIWSKIMISQPRCRRRHH